MIYRLEVLQKVNLPTKTGFLYMLDLMLKDAQSGSPSREAGLVNHQ
jgi:hypothetical protein